MSIAKSTTIPGISPVHVVFFVLGRRYISLSYLGSSQLIPEFNNYSMIILCSPYPYAITLLNICQKPESKARLRILKL